MNEANALAQRILLKPMSEDTDKERHFVGMHKVRILSVQFLPMDARRCRWCLQQFSNHGAPWRQHKLYHKQHTQLVHHEVNGALEVVNTDTCGDALFLARSLGESPTLPKQNSGHT